MTIIYVFYKQNKTYNYIILLGKKKRINLVAVCLNIFLPWFLFASLYAVLSFSFHYQHPGAAWLCVGLGLVLVLIAGGLALRAKKQLERDPSWYTS